MRKLEADGKVTAIENSKVSEIKGDADNLESAVITNKAKETIEVEVDQIAGLAEPGQPHGQHPLSLSRK